MKLRVSFDRITRPNCSSTVKYPLDWATLYYLEVKVNGTQVLLVEDATTTFIDSAVSADPSNTDVLLIDIPLINIWDSADVQVIAYHTEGSGDFSDDFSDDFSIGYINKYEYVNTFKVFGYDLGNNGADITHNPDFIINFLVNSLGDIGSPEFMLTDFNDDFNEDFATFCNCYADFIAYRRPLTDMIHVYDSVSTWVEPESRITERKVEYYDENQCLLGSTRNIIVCRKPDIFIYQKALQWIYVIEEGPNCGCGGGSMTKIVDKSCQTEMRLIKEVKYKYKPITSTTEQCGDCTEDCCEVVIEVGNDVYTVIDIDPMTWYWVDDLQKNLFNFIKIHYEVISHSGFLIDEHEIFIDTSTVYYYYNSAVSEWSYTVPDMGDFILRTTVEYLGYVEDIETDTPYVAMKCTTNMKLKACHWYEIKQVGCNSYEVFNRSFDTIEVTVYSLEDVNVTKVDRVVSIPPMSSVVIKHEEDNVYTYEVKRDMDIYTYVVINYCKLRECLLKKIEESICAQPVGRCQEEDYYLFNRLAIHMHTYFSMLVSEYNFNYIYTALQPHKLQELYGIKEFMMKMKKYCGNCPTLTNCGCGCS